MSVYSSKHGADEGVVVVTSTASNISTMNIMDIRRMYLGLPPINKNMTGKAIINRTDADTYNLFLKNIMHMTEYRYKRRLVKRIFRYGTSAIKEVESLQEISSHFEKNKDDITFISTSQLEQVRDVKVILRLW